MKVHGDSDYLDFCRNKFCAKDHEHEVLKQSSIENTKLTRQKH